ncbi:unnamed protein product [Didymodactylos carnosus]|uniref:Kinesin-like domain-containing protein n=1 Tax=Didymodactylos carnosus TaxID=1234261 RepID=A0A815YYY0_9BILA|nr:unnamed protein product [Didymodactylos carnosus]CAF4443733.1 unnamed protein product [Didymodactylos carnosus]
MLSRIQRRISITLCYESVSELIWKDVREVVVGRIRGQRDSVFDESDGHVLSLNVISARYLQKQHDERSLQNLFLPVAYRNSDANRVTAVYELKLKRAVDSISSGLQRKVIDTSHIYVRGEEMLKG